MANHLERPPEALTVIEAKSRAGCGRSMIYEEIKSGRLRARKLGRRTLILAADLADWLNSLPVVRP